MHFTVLIMYLHYYKLNSISNNKATNFLNQQFHSQLGACKFNYQLKIKLKNKYLKYVYLLIDIIAKVYLTNLSQISYSSF